VALRTAGLEDDVPIGVQPRQQRGIDKRVRLYEAAIAEFAEHGERAAKVERIVAAADLGWGTFFHYFPRKNDVLLAVGIELQDLMEAALTKAAADSKRPTREVVWEVYRVAARPIYGSRVHLAMIREVLASTVRYERMLGEREPMGAHLARVLAAGQERGEVRTDVDAGLLARLLHAAVLTTASRIGVPGSVGLPRDRDLAQVFKLAFRVVWAGIDAAAIDGPELPT
jgi:AcrR family transcriptional regulator